MSIMLPVLQTRIYTALLAAVGMVFIAAIDNRFSMRYIGPGYLSLDALISLLAVGFNWKVGRRFIAAYVAVTVSWLVLAFLLLTWIA